MNWKNILSVIAKFLGMILPLVTPEIKKMLIEFLHQLDEKAQKTENVFDDMLTGFLLELFDEN